MRNAATAFSLAAVVATAGQADAQEAATYTNPLPVTGPTGPVESCADPTVARDDGPTPLWVMLCTTDPLSGSDRDANGDLIFHLLPTFTSPDLVNWTYVGDAFDRDSATATADPPAWAEPDAALWGPDLARIGDGWLLTYAVTAVTDAVGGEPGCDEDSAIGHATATSPVGPWTPAPVPLIAPRRTDPGCEFLWTLDPEVFDDGQAIAFGSFHGGIAARRLVVADDGSITAPEATETPLVVAGRYEGAEIVAHDGWYWLFGSAANCCAGPQTGYATFSARSRDPMGPYLDRHGASLLDARVGGTPFIMQNGNAWVGPGHNTMIADEAGQWWSLYHAIEEADPWFAGEPGFTRRPLLLDRVDWSAGWPILDGGAGPSNGPRTAPSMVRATILAPPTIPKDYEPAATLFADGFDGTTLDAGWSGLRDPEVIMADGRLSLATAPGDLFEDADDAPILLRDLPDGDYMVEARLRLHLPPPCCDEYVQAGIVLHATDDDYLKLVVVAIDATRQIEFARELPDPPDGAARYGNAVGGPPGEDWTHLRLVVRHQGVTLHVTSLTSPDGLTWDRGATWTLPNGPTRRLGLVAMGGEGHTAEFDFIQIARLVP